jgi:L-seryl-tRNA(Ser) seleniumtransferase
LTDAPSDDPRRTLPSVDRVQKDLAARAPEIPSWATTEAARQVLSEAREALGRGATAGDIVGAALERARVFAAQRPRRVVNATGVVLHTNLGRAPLAPGAAHAAEEAAASYGDLELDLATGGRGQRLTAVAQKLRLLAGAEDALAVNNCAAAVLLALSALARGREVVVSRGELVEIGGSFRVPEILEQAGVRLVEVGTTNRTHPRDYERAIGPDTGALLKVHRSNFEQRGFVTEVDLPELAAIGRAAGVPVIEDLGSGTLVDLRHVGLPEASFAPGRLASGVDVVCFSGDKLLGGPQAGLVIGRAGSIDAMRRNPLARALRLDKMTLAALDWTLRALLEGREAELPVVRQLLEPAAVLRARADALAVRLGKVAPPGLRLAVAASDAPVGGGSVPGFTLAGAAVVVTAASGPQALAEALRRAPIPVIARIADDELRLEVRTLLPGDEEALEQAIASLVVPA